MSIQLKIKNIASIIAKSTEFLIENEDFGNCCIIKATKNILNTLD